MTTYPYGALVAGALLLIAAAAVLTRHFLLEPQSTRYPKAPLWLRNVLFAFAAVLAFVGLRYLAAFAVGAPDTAPPQPTASMILVAAVLATNEVALLANIARQRLPADTWRRLNRILAAVSCASPPCPPERTPPWP